MHTEHLEEAEHIIETAITPESRQDISIQILRRKRWGKAAEFRFRILAGEIPSYSSKNYHDSTTKAKQRATTVAKSHENVKITAWRNLLGEKVEA